MKFRCVCPPARSFCTFVCPLALDLSVSHNSLSFILLLCVTRKTCFVISSHADNDVIKNSISALLQTQQHKIYVIFIRWIYWLQTAILFSLTISFRTLNGIVADTIAATTAIHINNNKCNNNNNRNTATQHMAQSFDREAISQYFTCNKLHSSFAHSHCQFNLRSQHTLHVYVFIRFQY